MKKLILIDGHALVHRAFHALPLLTAPDGQVVNAVYGFTSILLKTIKELKPDYLAAAFDLAGPTFRHQEFEEYKAQRKKAPDELYAQLPLIKEILKAFGIPFFTKEGFEADDVIGSLAVKAKKNADLQTIVLTGDLDTLQLVDGKRVQVFTLRRGVSDTVLYDEEAVNQRYGLKPAQIPDLKGLQGDPSDNIPGVPGVGEKTALALLKQFGSLENLYRQLAQKQTFSKGKILTEKLAARLKENEDQAIFSKKLATIVTDLDLVFSLAEADWRKNFSPLQTEELFRRWGFFSLLKRVSELNVFKQSSAKSEGLLKENSVLALPTSTRWPLVNETKKEIYVYEAADFSRLPAVFWTDPQWTIVGHDLKSLFKKTAIPLAQIKSPLFDTALAAYLLKPDLKNYDFEKIFFLFFQQKGQRSHPEHLSQLKDYLVAQLIAHDLQTVAEKIEMPLIPVLAQIEQAGIKIDLNSLEQLKETVQKEISKLEKKIFQLTGTEFNLNSPQQLGEVLFEKMGLTKSRIKKTGSGALSTAAEELEKLREESPIIDLLLQYRELQKIKSTYLEPFPQLVNPGDGRLHTTFLQTGTVTGRLASRDPNLQNIPIRTELGQEFRKVFVAERGWELVSFDYSQLELRIIAYLAQDQKMLEAFSRGEDIHIRTAAEILEIKPEEVTSQQRQEAKALNFGLIYGMGVLGFARAAGINRTRAREFITKYLNEFSGVARFMEKKREEAHRQRAVRTWFGRCRELPEINSGLPQLVAQAERMAINTPVQGTGADIVKLAMIAINRYLAEQERFPQARIILQVHDELLLEIKQTVDVSLILALKEIMEKIWTVKIPLIVEVKKGENWAEMKKV